MKTEPMRDTTTDGLMFVRPIPQGSAPPDPKAFWTDEYGWLVPDTRLQAIADAPKCEHDSIDEHEWGGYGGGGMDGRKWCEGAPELRAAISALTEENKPHEHELDSAGYCIVKTPKVMHLICDEFVGLDALNKEDG